MNRIVVLLVLLLQHVTTALLQDFPSLEETMNMVVLSTLIYQFHDVPPTQNSTNHTNTNTNNSNDDYDAQQSQCDSWNQGTYRPSLPRPMVAPADLYCNWYYHSPLEGTQVMIASSLTNNYIAITFAGTDDYQTSLLDVDVLRTSFGDNGNWTLPPEHEEQHPKRRRRHHRHKRRHRRHHDLNEKSYPSSPSWEKIWVHAGFNGAVFAHGLQTEILSRLERAREQFKSIDGTVYVTGHSLGAAASLLSGVGLALHYFDDHNDSNNNGSISSDMNPFHQHERQQAYNLRRRNLTHDKTKEEASKVTTIKVINFGCPAVGNRAWRDFIHSSDVPQLKNLGIWRFVLGWDIVPRLPSTMLHVGHTVQMEGYDGKEDSNVTAASLPIALRNSTGYNQQAPHYYLPNNSSNTTLTLNAYYNHYGDKKLSYASVPWGWSSTPYIWVPGAINSHRAERYGRFFYYWNAVWLHEFVALEKWSDDDDDDGSSPPRPIEDDDDYWNTASY